jgi:hypothetical protein
MGVHFLHCWILQSKPQDYQLIWWTQIAKSYWHYSSQAKMPFVVSDIKQFKLFPETVLSFTNSQNKMWPNLSFK